jgi:hypothetical protein
MSKVVIQGNASGTGNFTIAAPNSNTDRTLTLPDEAGTVITTAGVPSSSLPSGSVLQVVSQSNNGGMGSTTNTSSYVASSETLSITPTSASSKVMVFISGIAQNGTSSGGVLLYVYKDGSQLYDGGLLNFSTTGGNHINGFCIQYLDSPATTSSVTYTLYFRAYSTGTAYLYDTQTTLMEIAA